MCVCVSAPQQTRSRGPGGSEPKQDADDDTWFPFMNETWAGSEESVWGGVCVCACVLLTCETSDEHSQSHPAPSFWTATYELVTKQNQAGSVRVSEDPLAPRRGFYFFYFMPPPRHFQSAVSSEHSLWPQCYKSVSVLAPEEGHSDGG